MRRLIHFLARLYPRAWRERYEAEFTALLEDLAPNWRDAYNVLGGALAMQFRTWNFARLMAGFGLAGAIAAVAVFFAMPSKYTSVASLRIQASAGSHESFEKIGLLQQWVLTRASLAELIQAEGVYQKERESQPLEDVIEHMRTRDIQIRAEWPDRFEVAFTYQDPERAERVTRALVDRMMAANQRNGGSALEVLDPPRRPNVASGPNPWLIIGIGLTIGLALGAITGLCMRLRWRTIGVTIACSAVCGMLGGALSFLVPNQYISTAVIRYPASAGNLVETFFTRDELESVIKRKRLYTGKPVDQAIREMRTRDLGIRNVSSDPRTAVVQISFRYTDRFQAQSALRDAILRFAAENYRVAEVLDAPSLPESPSYPNRFIIALIGAMVGLLVGALFSTFHNRRHLQLAPA